MLGDNPTILASAPHFFSDIRHNILRQRRQGIVMRTTLLVAIAGFFLAPSSYGIEMTVDERAVWELEEAYWQFVKAGDVGAYKEVVA